MYTRLYNYITVGNDTTVRGLAGIVQQDARVAARVTLISDTPQPAQRATSANAICYLVERVAGNGTRYRLSHLLAMHHSADLTEVRDAEFFKYDDRYNGPYRKVSRVKCQIASR